MPEDYCLLLVGTRAEIGHTHFTAIAALNSINLSLKTAML